jgi:3-oxoadipate enol-lactonase
MALTIINGETFHTQVDGKADAPWMVISNSLATNMDMWRPQIGAFSRHFRVLRYDARGPSLAAMRSRSWMRMA